MLKVTTLPMINVRQAAKEVAKVLNELNEEHDIFLDIYECLTNTDSKIVQCSLPEDEEECYMMYDYIQRTFFLMVKEATQLSWGKDFLANLE